MDAPHAADMDVICDHIRRYCPNMQTYLDVGAGDGYDCGVVERAFPEARCIAIDPFATWHPEAAEERYRAVVSQDWRRVPFHLKPTPGISGVYDRIAVETTSMLEVGAMSLFDFCRMTGVLSVDAMKLDVEGAALDVLTGFRDLMPFLRLIHVETEWIELFRGQPLEPAVFELLQNAGMTKVWENRVEELGQGDSIWVRQ